MSYVFTAEEAYIETFTGRKFYPLAPVAEQVDIYDIAHALSYVCRYTGHSTHFYSVADHSLLVSTAPEVVEAGVELEALLHDASEAYIADIAGPIKPFIAGYKEAEERLEQVIRQRFDLPEGDLHPAIKVADLRILVTEARSLGFSWWKIWRDERGVKPYELHEVPFLLPRAPADRIEGAFLMRFFDLGGKA